MAELNIKEISKLFEPNIQMILDELEDTNELYIQIKEHFDRIMNSTSSGALTFISKQTPNLLTAKANKINLIKELTAIQKIIIDSSIKIKSDDDKNGNDGEILQSLHKLLLTNNRDEYLKETESLEIKNEDKNVSNLDELLNSRLEEIEGNENIAKEDNRDYRIVVDMERNLYAVDEEYNILEDSEDLIPKDWIIDYEEDEDDEENISAFNQDGDEIEIISFEEE